MDAEAVRAALAAHRRTDYAPLPGRTNHLPAGVLVPLVEGDDPRCLLTVRAAGLTLNPGEISFPGGRPEPTDRDLADTALREAREELGLDEALVLGPLSSVPLYTSDHRLFPFVAAVPDRPLRPEPGEVACVLALSVRELLARPAIDAIAWSWEGDAHMAPVFDVGGRVIYGGTAYVLFELLQVLAPLLDAAVPPLVTGRYDWADVLPAMRP